MSKRAVRSLDPFPSQGELARMYELRTGRKLPDDPAAATACAVAAGVIGKGSPLVLLAITWPLVFTIPWSRLISDNDKYGAVSVGREHPKPRLLLQRPYREAKEAIRKSLRQQFGNIALAAVPLQLEGRVYVPDRRPHDCANFAKLVHDAIQEAVIANDRWLYDVRWIRAGVDVDRPRVEVTIRPIIPTPQE